ncbi:MAG: exodeoxyribonuclease VII large subunit [Methylacidiphilales bacterium]|nr:exodeoxyribonuclease VII large subunit [Candidatus Methylacidiphilales bacterium]
MTLDFSSTSVPDTAISVAGLTEYIQLILEENEILRHIWVIGEVSSANNHRVGLFFTLQDPGGTASIKCVTWKSQIPKLMQMPSQGEQVIILGSIRLYPSRGEYQLQVWQVLPAGEGCKHCATNNSKIAWKWKGYLKMRESEIFLYIPSISRW